MTINGKVHCFFEQSGTFKREFIKLGIPAEDYDIQNNFGETDHVVDLFAEIEKAWGGAESMFDAMGKDDLIMAFFPCIKFCNIAEYNQRSLQEYLRRIGTPIKRIYDILKKESDERYFFYQKCLKLHGVVETRGLRMIMENPWNKANYTNLFWFRRVTVIDRNRTRRGDYFVKPTGYWFTNCEPTHGFTHQQTPDDKRKYTGIGRRCNHPKEQIAKASSKSGICSEERSMISPDYAHNFICDFILGKPSGAAPQQADMFDEAKPAPESENTSNEST